MGDAVEKANEADIPTDRIRVLGFSQGTCLASEFVACNPTRYNGLAVLSGALIGETVDPDDSDSTSKRRRCSSAVATSIRTSPNNAFTNQQ